MGGGANAGRDPIAISTDTPTREVVVPFLLGTAVGGVAGAVAGTLLSHHAMHLLAALIGHVERRLSHAERDTPRFELLLQ